MSTNILPSEAVAVAGIIDADAYAAGTVTSGWVDMSKFHAALAVVGVGDMVATSTVDAKLEQATSSAGAGAKAITGKAITQLTQAGTDDNKQALIDVRPEDLDRDNGFRFVRLSMTVAAAASDAFGLLLGLYPRYGIGTANDLASVDETV